MKLLIALIMSLALVPSANAVIIEREAQAWWSSGASEANPQPQDDLNGRDEHAHLRITNYPENEPVSGVYVFNETLQIHECVGCQVWRIRIQDRSNTLVKQAPMGMTCFTDQCTFFHQVPLDTSSLSSGRHEMRFHFEMRRPDGAIALVTNGWYLCVRSCSPNITQAVTYPETEARHKWTEPDGTTYGYNNARLRSPVPLNPVSGVWCPLIRTLTGADGRPTVRSFVSIDASWHDYSNPELPNGNPGIVLVDEPNAINRQVCYDTTLLANGRHKLFMRGDGQAATGKQGGVYLVDFDVNN